MYVAGISSPADRSVYPLAFIALGHHKWSELIEAAAAYTDHIHGRRTLHIYPGDDPTEVTPPHPACGAGKGRDRSGMEKPRPPSSP
ncbi:hypothetical protein [Streptomyces sp. NPDC001604]|uniref:hypothetical protein n=1 Tax=Streptomyces sp. NPDC001604 TaxID=3364593 RepID=UPI003674E33F